MKGLKRGSANESHVRALRSILGVLQIELACFVKRAARNKAGEYKEVQLMMIAEMTRRRAALQAAIRALGGVA